MSSLVKQQTILRTSGRFSVPFNASKSGGSETSRSFSAGWRCAARPAPWWTRRQTGEGESPARAGGRRSTGYHKAKGAAGPEPPRPRAAGRGLLGVPLLPTFTPAKEAKDRKAAAGQPRPPFAPHDLQEAPALWKPAEHHLPSFPSRAPFPFLTTRPNPPTPCSSPWSPRFLGALSCPPCPSLHGLSVRGSQRVLPETGGWVRPEDLLVHRPTKSETRGGGTHGACHPQRRLRTTDLHPYTHST